MDRLIRDIKKEADQLVANGEIEDFKFERKKKHNIISFQYHGDWHTVLFASSPRTAYTNNFTRQSIRRKIRSLSP